MLPAARPFQAWRCFPDARWYHQPSVQARAWIWKRRSLLSKQWPWVFTFKMPAGGLAKRDSYSRSAGNLTGMATPLCAPPDPRACPALARSAEAELPTLAVLGRRRNFPTNADEYELTEECGRGVSATVRSCCSPY